MELEKGDKKGTCCTRRLKRPENMSIGITFDKCKFSPYCRAIYYRLTGASKPVFDSISMAEDEADTSNQRLLIHS